MGLSQEVDELAMGIYYLSRPYCAANKKAIKVSGNETELFGVQAVAAMRWGILQVSASTAEDCVCNVLIYDSKDRLQFSSKQLLRADGTAFTVAFYYKDTDRMSIRIASEGNADIDVGGAVVIIQGGKGQQ